MAKPRFQKIVSLTAAENETLEKINQAGVSTIDVFRAGMIAIEKKLKQEKN